MKVAHVELWRLIDKLFFCSFFSPFFLDCPFCCWLWQNAMADQNKWRWGYSCGRMCFRGHPLITSPWGVPEDCLYTCRMFVCVWGGGIALELWTLVKVELMKIREWNQQCDLCRPRLYPYTSLPSHMPHTFAPFLLLVLPYWVRLLSKHKAESWLFLCLSSPYGCMEGFGKPQSVKLLHCIPLHLPPLTSPLSLSFAVLTLSTSTLCLVHTNISRVITERLKSVWH